MMTASAGSQQQSESEFTSLDLTRCDMLVIARDPDFTDATCRRLKQADLRPRHTASVNQAIRWLQSCRPRSIVIHQPLLKGSASAFSAIASEMTRHSIRAPVMIASDLESVKQCIAGLASNSSSGRLAAAPRHEPAEPIHRIIANRLVIHPAHYEARFDGKLLTLSARQFHVLTLLASEKERAVERRRLAKQMGDHGHHGDVSDRAVDNLISRLRKRLEPGLTIESVRGIGYRLVSHD